MVDQTQDTLFDTTPTTRTRSLKKENLSNHPQHIIYIGSSSTTLAFFGYIIGPTTVNKAGLKTHP